MEVGRPGDGVQAEQARTVVDDSDGQFTRALRTDHTRHRCYFLPSDRFKTYRTVRRSVKAVNALPGLTG
ncbi:hypothetical protein DVG80_34060 [Rhodococcus erythropolis]|nr:hypothetical protein DVG80_34060 [Rhodococcus erythropolis]